MQAYVGASIMAMPALALDWTDALSWDAVFATADFDNRTAFVAQGGKKQLSMPDEGAKMTLAFVSGVSLSDIARVRRGKLSVVEIDRYSRLLLGLERSAGPGYTAVAIGPSLALEKPAVRPGRQRFGVALDAQVWLRPDTATYWAFALTGDTAARTLWARGRLGYRPEGWVMAAGPELGAAADAQSGKTRVGLHLGEITLGPFRFDVATGRQWDTRRRAGSYATLAVVGRY